MSRIIYRGLYGSHSKLAIKERRFLVMCSIASLVASLIEIFSLGFYVSDLRGIALFDRETRLGRFFRKYDPDR